MGYFYRALGLGFSAPFPCPGFLAGPPPDMGRMVRLELAPLPESLENPVVLEPLSQVDAAGRCLHHVPGVGRFLVHDRSRISIDPAGGEQGLGRALRALRGVPLAFLCSLWGMLPLHAACVTLGGRAVLLAGTAACGKSSLAAALALDGGKLMADEFCVLDPNGPGGAVIWPSFPELGLWPDSIKALGLEEPATPPGPGGRYGLEATQWFDPCPHSAAALAIIQRQQGGVEGTDQNRRQGLKAFEAVMNIVRVDELTRTLSGLQDRLNHATRLASELSVFEFWRSGELAALKSDAQRLADGCS